MDLLLNTIMLEPNRWTAEHALSWPLADLLEPIAEAGFSNLEVWGYHVDRLDERGVADLGNRLAAHSLRTLAVGAYPAFHKEGLEDAAEAARLERLVATSAALGARVFKIFPGRVASADADAALWARSLDRLRRLADRVAADGMGLTLETHGGTLCDRVDSTLRLLGDLDAAGADVGVCFQPYGDHDTGRAMAAFDALGGRVRHLHVQNRAADRTMTLLADGVWTDYGRFLPHVRDAGFDGLLCIEFTAGIVPAPGEAFDLAAVLGNAILDRRFVESCWTTRT